MGETESERQASFQAHLPIAAEPILERSQDAFAGRYRPNSVFLAHLLASRNVDIDMRATRQSEALTGVGTYRATAALPRQRTAGHVLKTER